MDRRSSAQPESADAQSMNKSSDGPDDYTTTNNQVDGVEEADVLKNDGKYIYHIAAGRLNILKSWPAESMNQVSSFEYKGRMAQMLLNGDQIILIGSPQYSEIDAEYVPEWVRMSQARYRPRYAYAFTKVIIVDISDRSDPKEIDTYLMKGSLNGARKISNSVRFILNDYGRLPKGVETWISWSNGNRDSDDEIIAKLELLKIANEKLIREKDLNYWLEQTAFTRGEGADKVNILDMQNCSTIHAPSVETTVGITRITTLNLEARTLHQTVLLSHSSQVYANEKSLYLATPYCWWGRGSQDTNFTFLHKFDLSDPIKSEYLGSGGVQGTLLNQFSMDEFEGVLRVATTITERIPEEEKPNRWQNWTSYNRVSTLGLEDDELKLLGQTADLAPDESIYSARFYGNRGFVVTFRQIDPLFTLDLSDPTDPKVVGKLKIPGFSNYMQLIDENHILAIGKAASLTGRVRGLKLSIFDVSDMSNPVESFTYELDGRQWSDATSDHKAFTYFAAKRVLGIPVSGYSPGTGSNWYDRYSSSLKLFDINLETGITARGAVEMNDIYLDRERDYGWWSRAAQVSRSIFADEFVYAVSNLGIRVTSIDNLAEPLSTVRYECDNSCFDSWWQF